MALNVKGVFYLTQALAPYLEAAGTKEDPARVINVGSVAGVVPQRVPTYAYLSYLSLTYLLSFDLLSSLYLFISSSPPLDSNN